MQRARIRWMSERKVWDLPSRNCSLGKEAQKGPVLIIMTWAAVSELEVSEESR